MKKIINISLITVLSASSLMGQNYLSGVNPKLTKEVHSLNQSKNWINRNVKSSVGEDGKVMFLYGATLPSIVTAPLRITDIQLEPGEVIKDFRAGDTVRWQISPSISGENPNLVSHIIIKPTDIGLKTTLAVMTNRRTYHFNLVSRKSDYMPVVGFNYKDKIAAEWANYQNEINKQEKQKEFQVAKGSDFRNIDSLNFDYIIEGSATWKPIRVYNDGVKTYIQMAKEMKFNEAPVLMVLDGSSEKMVNYRLKNDRYIVDKLFDEAALIMGVGSNQEKITISKKGVKKETSYLDILNNKDEG